MSLELKGFEAFKKALLDLKKRLQKAEAEVLVGITEQVASEQKSGADGLTVLDIAAIHEFGLGNVPSRSFIEGYVVENVDALHKMVQSRLKLFYDDKITETQMLNQLGLYASNGMKARISNGIAPELSSVTIKNKGGKEIPLIDSGQLRASITYRIDRKKP